MIQGVLSRWTVNNTACMIRFSVELCLDRRHGAMCIDVLNVGLRLVVSILLFVVTNVLAPASSV